MRRADYSSTGILPSLVCPSMIMNPRQGGGPVPLWAVEPGGGNFNTPNYLSCVTLPKLHCVIHNYFQEVALSSRFLFYFTTLSVCGTRINYGVERRERLS